MAYSRTAAAVVVHQRPRSGASSPSGARSPGGRPPSPVYRPPSPGGLGKGGGAQMSRTTTWRTWSHRFHESFYSEDHWRERLWMRFYWFMYALPIIGWIMHWWTSSRHRRKRWYVNMRLHSFMKNTTVEIPVVFNPKAQAELLLPFEYIETLELGPSHAPSDPPALYTTVDGVGRIKQLKFASVWATVLRKEDEKSEGQPLGSANLEVQAKDHAPTSGGLSYVLSKRRERLVHQDAWEMGTADNQLRLEVPLHRLPKQYKFENCAEIGWLGLRQLGFKVDAKKGVVWPVNVLRHA